MDGNECGRHCVLSEGMSGEGYQRELDEIMETACDTLHELGFDIYIPPQITLTERPGEVPPNPPGGKHIKGQDKTGGLRP